MKGVHRLARIDLNLLLVFDTVFEEQSVTGAAKRLSLSQTAVSHSLARLREQFKDPLFVRVGSTMRPTPRAMEISPMIRSALEQVDSVVSKRPFSPSSTEQVFRIAITEYFGLLALPLIVKRLATEAMNTTLITVPNILTNVPVLLDNREIDFAVAYFQDPLRDLLPPRLKAITLSQDHYVCMMRKDHPLARRKLTKERYAEASHLVFSLHGETLGPIDRVLKQHGIHRKVGMQLCHHSVIPGILSNSDMILTFTSRMAKYYAGCFPFHVSPMPFNIPQSPMQLVWSERVDASPSHTWMRSIIIEECQKI